MATGLAAATANALLNALARNTSYAVASLYLQLHTADPGSAGTTAIATENTRKLLTFGSVASAGSISTTADTVWTNVAGTETYSHVSLWDAVTSGTFIASASLATPKAVNAGDNFQISTGQGTLNFTPLAS